MTNFFNQGARELANNLNNRHLVRDDQVITITNVEAFPGSQEPRYQPVMALEPGGVYIAPFLTSALVLIRSNDGCVLISGIVKNDQQITGPGRVAAALGIRTRKRSGHLAIRPDRSFELVLPPEASSPEGSERAQVRAPKPKANRNGNGLGQETLARYMKRLTEVWQATPTSPRERFQDFLNRVLQECKSEHELVRWLRQKEGK